MWSNMAVHFKQNDFLLQSTTAKPYLVHLGQKNSFSSKLIQKGPDGPQRVPNGQKHFSLPFGLFRTYFDHYGTLTSLPGWAIFGPNETIFGPKRIIFGPSPFMNSGPLSKKRLITRSPVWPACRAPKPPFWNINMAAIP